MKNDDNLLSDADLDALANKVREKFYADIGRGLWGLMYRAILPLLAVIAAFGAARKGEWF